MTSIVLRFETPRHEMGQTWGDGEMLASAAIGQAAVFLQCDAFIADRQKSRGDKGAATRMFFFNCTRHPRQVPICMAEIYFCKYPWCNRDRNPRAARRSNVRAPQ
jgi:hypothetical protein